MISLSGGVPIRFPWPVPFPRKRKISPWKLHRSATTLYIQTDWIKHHHHHHVLFPLREIGPLFESSTTQILQWYHQASELQLPLSLKQWKHWAKWQQLGAKCTVQFQKNIHTTPTDWTDWNFLGGGQFCKAKTCVKLNWNFQRGRESY